MTADGRWALSGSKDHTLRLWELDWELEAPEPADWHEGAKVCLMTFLYVHTPYAGELPQGREPSPEEITQALSRRGRPSWTDDDSQDLLRQLQDAGYGWLRPEGVRRKLEEMAANWQGPPPLPGERTRQSRDWLKCGRGAAMAEEHPMVSSQGKPIGWAGLTHVGKVRQTNEDAFCIDAESGLFLVSDGMGGHQAGALASKIVATVLPQMIRRRLSRATEPSTRSLNAWLKADVLELSLRLRTDSMGLPDLHGMGATLVMAFLRGSKAHVVHMGDSRAYLLRAGRLKQLTEDHSIVGILLRQGGITQEEARHHPARGQLSRYLGMEGEVFPGLQMIDLKQDDRLLLCSDGLSGTVSDEDIARLLSANQDPATACRVLIDAANAAGGPDNITAVIIDWRVSSH